MPHLPVLEQIPWLTEDSVGHLSQKRQRHLLVPDTCIVLGAVWLSCAKRCYVIPHMSERQCDRMDIPIGIPGNQDFSLFLAYGHVNFVENGSKSESVIRLFTSCFSLLALWSLSPTPGRTHICQVVRRKFQGPAILRFSLPRFGRSSELWSACGLSILSLGLPKRKQ